MPLWPYCAGLRFRDLLRDRERVSDGLVLRVLEAGCDTLRVVEIVGVAEAARSVLRVRVAVGEEGNQQLHAGPPVMGRQQPHELEK